MPARPQVRLPWPHLRQRPRLRPVHIQATPSTSSIDGLVDLSEQTQAIPKLSGDGPFPADVTFEVLGAPYSLLSVSLPASSILYSRRGTLVGINGKVENATSTLSLLEPIRRSLLGIPFVYQRISSSSPLTCLISTNSPNTTFGVLQLDGKADWQICQRNALLAWTGHSLGIHPSFSPRMSLAHWGTSRITGRGLVGLVGNGQIYQATLNPGESFIVHPSALLAYSILERTKKPGPFRMAGVASRLRLQIPPVFGRWLQSYEFVRTVVNSDIWKTLAKSTWEVKNWIRRVVWGDRLFLRFEGPATVLLQSRTARLRDVVTSEDVNELASVTPGVVTSPTVSKTEAVAETTTKPTESAVPAKSATPAESAVSAEPAVPVSTLVHAPTGMGAVTVKGVGTVEAKRTRPQVLRKVIVNNGTVKFEDSDFKEFQR